MMNSGADLTDLLRGEGEWRNMQEIVRKTFKQCFDQMQNQSEQINKLVGKVRSLKEELASKPDTEEILKLIANKAPKPSRSSDDVERIKAALTSLRADIERKASLSYVDDSLKRKIDKSDILVHNLSKITSSQYISDINQLQHDLVDIRTHLDLSNEKSTQNYKELKASYVGDVSLFKAQLTDLESKASQWVTKSELRDAQELKAGKVELESLLSRKADTANLEAFASRIEASLGEHEKLITTLRIRANEDGLRSGDTLLRNHPLTQPSYQLRGVTGPLSEELLREESDLGSLLKTGRIEAIVQGLWTKMNTVTADSQRSTQDVINMKAQLLTVENSLKSCAGQHHVETLAAAFEEQRLRLDSLILGSTTIEPVSRQLKQCSVDVNEIKQYLRLPQKKPLRDQLQEAGELIDVLSHSVSDLRAMASRTVTRLDVVEANTSELDTRVRVLESGSHRVDQLLRHTDLSEAEHKTVRAVSDDVSALWARLQGIAREARGECAKQCQQLADRIESVENEVVLSDVKHAKAVEELRDLHRGVTADLQLHRERITACDQQHREGERRMEVVVDKVKELRQSVRSVNQAQQQQQKQASSYRGSRSGGSARSSAPTATTTATAAAVSAPMVIFSDTESSIQVDQSLNDDSTANAAANAADAGGHSGLGLSGIAGYDSVDISKHSNIMSPLKPTTTAGTTSASRQPRTTSSSSSSGGSSSSTDPNTAAAANKENLRQASVGVMTSSDASTTTAAGGSAEISKPRVATTAATITASGASERRRQASAASTSASAAAGGGNTVSVAVGGGGEERVSERRITADRASGSNSSSSAVGDRGSGDSAGEPPAHHSARSHRLNTSAVFESVGGVGGGLGDVDLSMSEGINLPAALSLLQTSKFVALTSVEKIDERLATLKAEKEALKRRLLSTVEI